MVIILRVLALIFGVLLRPFRRTWKRGLTVRCLMVGFGGANNTGAEVHAAEAIAQMRAAAGCPLDITITSLNRMRSLRYMSEDEHLRIVELPSLFVFTLVRLVARADVVVLVEGYCFMESFSKVLLWLFMFAADIAQRMGIATVAYAVDAGELCPANRRWTARVAERMDLLMMRTEAAAGVMRSMGVRREILVTADTAFSIVPESDQWAKNKFTEVGFDPAKPVLGIAFEEFFWWPVAPRLWRFLTGRREGRYRTFYYHTWSPKRQIASDAMKRSFASFADWASGELGMQIAFFAMDRVNHDPCADVIRLMTRPAALIDADRYDGRQMTALLRSCAYIVAAEYHALLLAMGAGVPAIGLGHDERIGSVMDELRLREQYYIHYTEKDIEGRLREAMLRLRGAREHVRLTILDALPAYLRRMALNGEYFRGFLERRFPT